MGVCASAFTDTRLRPEDIVTIIVTNSDFIKYELRCMASDVEQTIKTGQESMIFQSGVRSFGELFDALAAGHISGIASISVQCRDDAGIYIFHVPMEHLTRVVDAAYKRVIEMRKNVSAPEVIKDYKIIKRETLSVSGNMTEDTLTDIRALLCMEPINRIHFFR